MTEESIGRPGEHVAVRFGDHELHGILLGYWRVPELVRVLWTSVGGELEPAYEAVPGVFPTVVGSPTTITLEAYYAGTHEYAEHLDKLRKDYVTDA